VAAATVSAFLLLFGPGLVELVGDWLRDTDYLHGFLLLGVALYLAWRDRRRAAPSPSRRAGGLVIGAAVLLFLVASVASEHFTMRLAALAAGAGLVLFYVGPEQLRAWWLPFALMVFAIPLPEVVVGTVTLPLQLFASRSAAALLRFRHVPSTVSGNIINLPGQRLFVAQACSGLRSLSALFGLTLLMGGTWLDRPADRIVLLVAALPVALLANVFRIFVTGFLAYFVGTGAVTGEAHESAGLLVFAAALGVLGLLAWMLKSRERSRVRA